RHQKVVEEAPAANLHADVRDGLHRAAVAAAKAIDYVGAGTVEFLVDGTDYYFLEMNTRLQVEHPVTEEITGLDLVGWQLDVAAGEPLPPFPTVPDGHAIEVRLYAEDARNDDLPSTGRLALVDFDDPRIRVDTGVADGDTVSPYYDPMLAKVIAYGPTRTIAAARLAAGLRSARIHGVTTNRDMLVAICESPAFASEVTTTAFLIEHPQVREQWPDDQTLRAHALAAAAVAWHRAGADVADVRDAGSVPPAWRNVARPGGVSLVLAGEYAERLGAESISIHRRGIRVGSAEAAAGTAPFQWGVAAAAEATGTQAADEVEWLMGTTVTVDADGAAATVVADSGVRRDARVACYPTAPGAQDGGLVIWVDDPREHSTWLLPARFPDTDSAGVGGGPSAPVPGTIVAVLVAPGDEVSAGDPVVILEAMKMEHRISTDSDGVVGEVLVAVGDSVDAHQVVVRLAAGED
ncbi:MAG: acetyl/propionyl-CoA carboxylase subunit alpha, partial [Actinobacteria bacterium]|nr:acetyl/propionyl-CoA carboxylase subunit alpha [Actinomycetota bacterium]